MTEKEANEDVWNIVCAMSTPLYEDDSQGCGREAYSKGLQDELAFYKNKYGKAFMQDIGYEIQEIVNRFTKQLTKGESA